MLRAHHFTSYASLKTTSTALLLIFTLSSCATPQAHRADGKLARLSDREKGERAKEIFDELDANHDGYLSREEVDAGIHRLSQNDERTSKTAQDATALTSITLHNLNTKKTSARVSHFDKFKKLSPMEQDQLIHQAFSQSKLKDADKERLSREDFRKIVVGAGSSVSEDNPAVERDTNPWEKVL